MTKKEYKFNPETLSYEVVKDPLRLRMYRFMRRGIVLFIAVCMINLVFSSMYYTPKMKRIEREREELLFVYGMLNDKIGLAAGKLSELKERDKNVYRLIFAADTITIPGAHNPYPESRYAYMIDNPYGDVVSNTWRHLDAVSRGVYLQSKSLDQLQELALDKERMASAVPAIWPIDRRNLRKMDHFGGRIHPIYKVYKMHLGTDMGAHIGDAVYATGNAVVKSTSKGQRKVGYGQQILLDHGFGYQTRYAHLSSIDVKPGQIIKRGEQIGKVGSTGGSTGPHLHYEVIYMGKHVDPINYLKRDMTEAEFESIIEAANTTTFETDFIQ